MDMLIDLLKAGKIDKMHYDTYVQFGLSQASRDYLNSWLMMVCMEEPPKNINAAFAWKDGRISVIRQIKLQIELVDNLLKGVFIHDHDTSSANGTTEPYAIPGADFSDSIPRTT